MVSKQRFLEIKAEVESAVIELFDYVAEHNNNYILILADAEYKDHYSGQQAYVIANMEDYYKEHSRLEFSQHFLNAHYTFGQGQSETTDALNKVYLEMMVYCHIWESTKFLKQLFRMCELALGKVFPWEIDDFPESGKHKIIRETIRSGFEEKNLKVADVITKGFHTSLRNSFLHGEFEINEKNKRIRLHTYRSQRKLKSFELNEISFDEWTERFLYSAFLNYCYINEKEKRRQNVIKDFKSDEFLIVHPRSKTSFGTTKIYFDDSRKAFSFYRTETMYESTRKNLSEVSTKPAKSVISVISTKTLRQLEKAVGDAVADLLAAMKAISEEQYIAFLFDVSQDAHLKQFHTSQKPEELRFKFSGQYLAVLFENLDREIQIPDIIRLQIEMLIYSHIWESKLLLKQINTAVQIIEGSAVSWNYTFPDDRRMFIDDLCARLKSQNLKLGVQIEQAFHTSLRNAFAHSDYDIHFPSKSIYLDTFKPGTSWDIPSITFDEWMEKFLLSFIIDFQFFIRKELERQNIKSADVKVVLSKMNQKK